MEIVKINFIAAYKANDSESRHEYKLHLEHNNYKLGFAKLDLH